MRILVLDDSTDRHVIFAKKTLRGHDLTPVFTVEGAKQALDTELPFDAAFLDHDLGDWYKDQDGKVQEATGQHVVLHIMQMPPERRPRRVIVHSWNTGPAQAMVSDLKLVGVDAEYQPFKG